MNYHLYKGTAWAGPYSIEQIKIMVGNGSVTMEDYVCVVGSQTSHQIKSLPELHPKQNLPPIPPAIAPSNPPSTTKRISIGCLSVFLGLCVLSNLGHLLKRIKDGKTQTQISSGEQDSVDVTVGKWKMTFKRSGTADDPIFEYKTAPIPIVTYNNDARGELIGGSFPAMEALREITTKVLQFIKVNENLNSLTLKITVTQPNTYEQDRYGNETTIKHPDVVRVLTLSRERLDNFRKYRDAEYLEKGEPDIDDLSALLGGERKR